MVAANHGYASDRWRSSSNEAHFASADLEALFGAELLPVWSRDDVRVFSLETPITDEAAPIDKCDPHLRAPVSVVRGVVALNPSLVCLANNHILDQGSQGLASTAGLC